MRQSPTNGFTLVEISIVMIIIGLLIGGTFGGMKLVENMQVNRAVQDISSVNSAALTFKDTFGRLPGDLPNSATRLPGCTAAPCATGGDGNRILDSTLAYEGTITATSERFTFWHHLQAANLLAIPIQNTTTMTFGEGQPESPVGNGGYRMTFSAGISNGTYVLPRGHVLQINSEPSIWSASNTSVPCQQTAAMDRKMDDGLPRTGMFMLWYYGWCQNTSTTPVSYAVTDNPALVEVRMRF